MKFEINPRAPTIGSEVLQAAAAGAQDAWDQIVETYAGSVWAAARRQQLTPQGAEAVSRLTWLRLADRLGEVSPETLGSWLEQTAERESIRATRLLALEEPEDEAQPA
jgi:DNA-directed RNA polymerase specialized sigma24 family protein